MFTNLFAELLQLCLGSNYFWTSKREKESFMDQQNRICKLLTFVGLSKWTVSLAYVYFFFSSNLCIKIKSHKEVPELQAHKLIVRDAIGRKWQFHGQNYSMVIHWNAHQNFYPFVASKSMERHKYHSYQHHQTVLL